MSISPLANVLPFPQDDAARLPPVEIDLGDGTSTSMQDGARLTELPDGSAEVDLSPQTKRAAPDKFGANLAEHMDEAELNRISSEILEGINRDDQSRTEHLEMIAEGIKLLGLVIESPNVTAGNSSAPLEGMSTVRHPLLLEACQLFQANAMGELLPAAGPCKVRDDRPQPPSNAADPGIGHNGGPPLDNPFTPPASAPTAGPLPVHPPMPMPPLPAPQQSAPAMPGVAPGAPPIAPPVVTPPSAPDAPRDSLADGLEKDFNHYLTVVAKEYVPDTDQMLFKVGFGGLGIKKVFHCPIRRRPVSESIDIEDFIVSNALSDLSSAGRITHRIKMRPSTLKRMQILNVYRDVPIGMPTQSESPNAVDQAKAEVAGVQPQTADPRDADHVLYECYCELDLDEYAPPQFKGKGLPLPYKVTIEKDSQKVLEVRRNWKENDDQAQAREFFVDFPYMRAFGFYCIGLVHLLGNTTKALTALWREFIDAGMFANFPGFLYVKGAGRQVTNQFRVGAGQGVGLDISVNDIRQAVMPLPYKSPDAGFTAFVQHVEELGQRLGGTANVSVGEGRQDAPVGTTLALIEQATKPVGAVNKRLHTAQAKEFMLLKERFKEDPESFWRFNKRPSQPWQREQFVAALNDYDLIPVSDPNNPTRLHRAAKAEALKQTAVAAPGLLDPWKTFLRWAREMQIEDVEDLKAAPTPPQQPPVDPAKMANAQAKIHGDQLRSDTDLKTTQIEAQGKLAEIGSRIQLAQIEQETERLRLAGTFAIHSDKIAQAREAVSMNIASDHAKTATGRAHDLEQQRREHEHDIATAAPPVAPAQP